MAVTHVTTTRNAISDAVLVEIGASGKLVLRPSGDTPIIATLPLSATAGIVGTTDLVFEPITSDTSAVAGTVSYLTITTSADVEVFRFLEGDITVSNTVIGAGDTVACSALTYVPPA